MKKWICACMALLSVSSLTSCNRFKPIIESRAFDVTHAPKRIMVIQKTPNLVEDAKNDNPFKSEFSRMLDLCGVKTAFSVNDFSAAANMFIDSKPSELADVDSDKIAALKPDSIFEIREVSSRYNSYSMVRTYNLEAELRTPDKTMLWRSVSSTTVRGLVEISSFDELAHDLVIKMKKDQILTTCPQDLEKR